MPRPRLILAAKWLLSLYCVVSIAGGITLAELSLRLHKLPLGDTAPYRATFLARHGTPVQDVSIQAADGAILKAWWLQPSSPNGRSVIILHGVTANRIGSTGFAEMFLTQGYSVLVPDSREHGESGGNLATYGILERYDTKQWIDWMRQRAPACTYLLGESMGAAVGLQTEAVSPRLCAVAVEDPFARFREIEYERLARWTHSSPLLWKTIGRPLLETATLYPRIRYGLYLPNADPEFAVQQSTIPTLLITGTADINIPMHHAVELEQACASHCTLWIVPGAQHGDASAVAHAEFEHRILTWFATHNAP